MNLFKRLFRVFEAKTNSLAVSSINALDNYNMAATKLLDQIERMSKQKNSNTKALNDFQSKAKVLETEADSREIQIKALLGKGASIDKAVVTIILRKRQLAEGLNSKADKLAEANKKLNENIVAYGDRLESLKAQLELARLEETFKKEGIALPDQVDFDVEDVSIDVDRLLSEVNVFTDSESQSAVTSLDVDAYLAELRGEKA